MNINSNVRNQYKVINMVGNIEKLVSVNDTLNRLDERKVVFDCEFNPMDFDVWTTFHYSRYVEEEESSIIHDSINLKIHVKDFKIREVEYHVYNSDCDYGILKEGLASTVYVGKEVATDNIGCIIDSAVNISVKEVSNILLMFTNTFITEWEMI